MAEISPGNTSGSAVGSHTTWATELLLVLAKVPRSAWRALYTRIERIALSIGWGRILLRHALVGTPARTDKKSGGE